MSSISKPPSKSSRTNKGSSEPLTTTLTLPEIRTRNRELYEALVRLSSKRVIWLGRYGYGATLVYRRKGAEIGTAALLESLRPMYPGIDMKILDNLMLQGSIFASYDSLEEYLGGVGFTPTTPNDDTAPEEGRESEKKGCEGR